MLKGNQKDFKLQLENCSKEGSNLNGQKEVLEVENFVPNHELEILKGGYQTYVCKKTPDDLQMQGSHYFEAVSRREIGKKKRNISMVQVVSRETPVM